ncbi:MAG: hypothetical protein ACKO2G_08730 [Verrucomicrobiales bacterium]
MRAIFPAAVLLTLLFVSQSATPVQAGDGKQKHTFAFHEEGAAADGPNKVFPYSVAGQEKFFRMTPTISHVDFEGFVPFRAEGGGFGAAFVLGRHGKLKLEQISTGRQGSSIVASVDMKPVDVMTVDKPIKDGVIVLWKGLGPEHIQYLEKELKIKVIKGEEPAKE